MDKKYYTYVYLDPRKVGHYVYGDYEFNNEPFYIGKGCGDRFKEHLRESSLKIKSHKNRKINKILSMGLEPIIIIVSENIFESDAFELEKKLIKIIGRYDLKNGPLTNITDGGEGLSGLIKSDEHKEKLSKSHTNKKMSLEARNKISISMLGNTRRLGYKTPRIVKDKISKTKKEQNIEAWNRISILQLSKNGDFIKEWSSSHEAASILGLNQGNINSVVNGKRKTCGNFKWVKK